MLGLTRRKQVAGWAIDVSENGHFEPTYGIRQRVADSNKVWVVSIAVIVVIALVLMAQARHGGVKPGRYIKNPQWPSSGAQATAAHVAFSREFAQDKSVADKVIDARFIGQRRFRVVVPAQVSADDMHYIARMAARKILLRFDHLSTVELYEEAAATGKRELSATTRWDAEKYGFVVKDHKQNLDIL
jgi:hypothetical protein